MLLVLSQPQLPPASAQPGVHSPTWRKEKKLPLSPRASLRAVRPSGEDAIFSPSDWTQRGLTGLHENCGQ